MIGGRHGWQGIASGILLLAGCVGLGDTPSGTVATNRPRRRAADESPTPDLRIADDTVAQAGRAIPLVPLPTVGAANQATPPSAAPRTERGLPPTQADGTRPTPPHTARQLLEQAAARCATLDSYIVRLTAPRTSQGQGQRRRDHRLFVPQEPVQRPFQMAGRDGQGPRSGVRQGSLRRQDSHESGNRRRSAGAGGARLSLSPNNPLVRSASRHPITDAGVCHCVESLIVLLDAQERGDHRQGTLLAIAPQRRPEYPQPIETLERLIPPNVEPELPRGGRRLICFDPDQHLPLLVVTYDDKGNEVEYYRYDRLIAPANLDDDDFNPDKLWTAPKPASPQRQPG